MSWRAAVLALAAAVPAGCVYRVSLSATPEIARIELPNGRVVATPNEVRLRWAPFERQPITASAAGYRPLTVDLRESEIRWTHLLHRRSRRSVELVLIPEHGPAGTWTADQVR